MACTVWHKQRMMRKSMKCFLTLGCARARLVSKGHFVNIKLWCTRLSEGLFSMPQYWHLGNATTKGWPEGQGEGGGGMCQQWASMQTSRNFQRICRTRLTALIMRPLTKKAWMLGHRRRASRPISITKKPLHGCTLFMFMYSTNDYVCKLDISWSRWSVVFVKIWLAQIFAN